MKLKHHKYINEIGLTSFFRAIHSNYGLLRIGYLIERDNKLYYNNKHELVGYGIYGRFKNYWI